MSGSTLERISDALEDVLQQLKEHTLLSAQSIQRIRDYLWDLTVRNDIARMQLVRACRDAPEIAVALRHYRDIAARTVVTRVEDVLSASTHYPA